MESSSHAEKNKQRRRKIAILSTNSVYLTIQCILGLSPKWAIKTWPNACDEKWMFANFCQVSVASQNLVQFCFISQFFQNSFERLPNSWILVGLNLKCDEFMNKKWNYRSNGLCLRALEPWFPLGVGHDCIWCHNQTKLEKKEMIWVHCTYSASNLEMPLQVLYE